MGLCIDRNHNVIINMGGRAHHTGWVVLTVVKDLYGMEPVGKCLSRGRGYCKGALHKTEAWGAILRYEEPLTAESFRAITEWSPEVRG